MPHETLIVERDGPVLKVTMNRPEARNALSPVMVRELTEVFLQARDEAEIRVVVLMGAGGTFCAGGDLKGMESRAASGGGAEATAASNRRFGVLLEMADALPKAVIVLDRGCGDGRRRRARRHCRLGHCREERADRHAGGDGRPGAGADRAVRGGAHRLHASAAAGQLRSAPRRRGGLRIGLVHELADGRGDLMAKGVAAINQVLRCAPEAIAVTKKLVRASLREPLGPTLDAASHMFAAALAGEAREGIRSFVEKRKPAWAKKIERL